jgi:5-methylcytosine-specific restriction endonuclease McrA
VPPYVSADPYVTSHLSNRELLLDFDACVARDRKSFAVLLTRIAEIDERRLYLPEGYSCMRDFLVGRMRLTEDAAYKRLTAARLARQYTGILVGLSDGRLTLRAVLMLGRHLNSSNADQLVRAALDKTRFELEVLLAEPFPRPDLPERLEAVTPPTPPAAWSAPGLACPLAPERVEATIPDGCGHGEASSAPPLAPERVEAIPRQRIAPLSPRRLGFQFTGDIETRELYEQYRALVSHEIPSGEMALVFKDALRIAVAERTKRKFAATDRPGPSRGSTDPRHVPAAVRRAVCERDQKRCTFVSESGKGCDERGFLEYDHVEPIARGGKSTVENIRLRCRAHNQFEAERAFGAEFMERKRDEAMHAGNP